MRDCAIFSNFDQTTADGERKALEDAEAQMRLIEEEYKNRY